MGYEGGAVFDPTKTIVIANPMARHGFVGEHWPELSARIRGALGPVDLQLTASRGDGLRMGRQAVENGARTVISFRPTTAVSSSFTSGQTALSGGRAARSPTPHR